MGIIRILHLKGDPQTCTNTLSMVYKGQHGNFDITQLSTHILPILTDRHKSMSKHLDIIPHSLSHIKHTACTTNYLASARSRTTSSAAAPPPPPPESPWWWKTLQTTPN